MLLARVVGTVVASRKDPKIEGLKFLLLRQVNPENLKEGGFVVANDAVGCGLGEYVLYASGSSARQTKVTKDRPVDATIMAIVDIIEVEGTRRQQVRFDAAAPVHLALGIGQLQLGLRVRAHRRLVLQAVVVQVLVEGAVPRPLDQPSAGRVVAGHGEKEGRAVLQRVLPLHGLLQDRPGN